MFPELFSGGFTMFTHKRFWMVFMALSVVLVGMWKVTGSARAEEETVNGITYTYTVNGNNTTITRVTPEQHTVCEIPATLGGKPVTSIGVYAFSDCTVLESVRIPASVTSIEESAVYNCTSLTSVTFENNSSLTTIGDFAFTGCSKLKRITIPAGVTSIALYAFSGCTSLMSVSFENHSNLTRISNNAFEGCTSLTGITIPAGVTSIGRLAFSECGLTSVEFEANSKLTSIGESAFYKCKNLTSLTIPAGVTRILGFAFQKCSNLMSLTIPTGVTAISNWTFDECTSLKSITIPAGVTKINSGAFLDCTSLSSIYYKGTKAQWDSITKGDDWNKNVPNTCEVICSEIYTVTYEVKNGEWDNGGSENREVKLSRYENEDKILKLEDGDIPAVGHKPAAGYQTGDWDVTPDTDIEITSNKTYIYTYTEAPTYTLTATAPTFDAVTYGYAQPAAKAITIVSTGNRDAMVSSAALSGADAGCFVLNKTNGTTITAGSTDSTTYTIQPIAGLDFRDIAYTATITVTYNGGAMTTDNVSFLVDKADAATASVAANNRIYDGTAIPLVTVTGEPTGGTMYYAVTTENTAPADTLYTTSIPSKTDAGTYYVWYKTVGDANHNDSAAACVTVRIFVSFGTPTIRLPSAIKQIEESAFEGLPVTIVEIPSDCQSIGKWAFKNCASLTQIRIPAGCALGTDVFDGCALVYVFGVAGCPAEVYCQSHENCIFIKETQN